MRRPRTEARPRRADNAKGLTNQGPLQKGGQSEACPPFTLRSVDGMVRALALPTLPCLAYDPSNLNETLNLAR